MNKFHSSVGVEKLLPGDLLWYYRIKNAIGIKVEARLIHFSKKGAKARIEFVERPTGEKRQRMVCLNSLEAR